jgi:hypothetical protein
MKRKTGLAVFIFVLISGCAAQKQLVATGGSRSDGIVKMSYEHGSWETPKIDYTQAVDSARQRCEAWGYTGAEPFGGMIRIRQAGSLYVFDKWLVTIEYQCTG